MAQHRSNSNGAAAGFLISKDADVHAKGHSTEAFKAEQHAHRMRRRGEADMEHSALNVKSEYRKRLVDSKDLLARLQQHVEMIHLETQHCDATRADAVKLLAEFQRPLMLTMQWIETRSGRPPSPGQDGVERALAQSRHDMKQQLAAVTEQLTALDAAMAQLRSTKQRFEEEIRDKSAAITLDKACLVESFKVPEPAAVAPLKSIPQTSRVGANQKGAGSLDPAPSGHSSGMSSPLTPRPPAHTTAMMHSIGMHTESEYRNTTMVSISRGTAAIEAASRARKVLAATIVSLVQGGKLKKPTVVVDALSNRVKESSQQLTALKYNSKMVSGELQGLQKQQAALQATLDKVQSQLKESQRRLDLRLVRPVSENARSEVEETLEREIVKLQGVAAGLQHQIADMETKAHRLSHLIEKINKELAYRSDALGVDVRCQEMALPSLPQIADRYKAVASSPRSQR